MKRNQKLSDTVHYFFDRIGIDLRAHREIPLSIEELLGSDNKNTTHALINGISFVGVVGNDSYDDSTRPKITKDTIKNISHKGIQVFAVNLIQTDTSLLPENNLLTNITRRIHRKHSFKPTIVIFRCDKYLSVTYCRGNLTEVKNIDPYSVQKVFLLKNVNLENISLGHQRILQKLSVKEDNVKKRNIENTDYIHEHWKYAFDTKPYIQDFCDDISCWYDEIVASNDSTTDIIKTVIKAIFAKFIKEKGIISDNLFYSDHLQKSLFPLNRPMKQQKDNKDASNSYHDNTTDELLEEVLHYIRHFAKHDDEHNKIHTNKLEPNKESKKLTELINILNSYNFTVVENTSKDEEIAIDAEIIGTILEMFLIKINHSDLITKRKQTGAFYTPKDIVDYMVNESIIIFLKTELLSFCYGKNETNYINNENDKDDENEIVEKLRNLCSYKDDQPFTSDKIKHEIVRSLLKCKIFDSCCGSGAFPIGALQKINSIISKIDTDNTILLKILNETGDRRHHHLVNCENNTNNTSNTSNTNMDYLRKSLIIGHCLHGTDIQHLATEICKMRLFISTISGLNVDSYLELCNGEKMGSYILDSVNDNFISTNALEMINKMYELGKTSHLFHTKFDIVIGNPPYIDSETMINIGMEGLRKYITENYKYTKGNWDIYIAFLELAFKKAKDCGIITYITPDKWLTKSFGSKFREHGLKYISSIMRSGRSVFDSVGVDSIITTFQKTEIETFTLYTYENNTVEKKQTISKDIITHPYRLDIIFSGYLDIILDLTHRFDTLSSKGFICENACSTSDAYKLKEYLNDANTNDIDSQFFYKIINTGTIDKFASRWGKKKMSYIKHKYMYPVIEKHKFESCFPNSYGKKASKKKLILKGMTLLDATLDDMAEFLPGKSTLMITSEKGKSLAAISLIINSKLSQFYLMERYPSASYNKGINFTKDMINSFPVPDISSYELAMENLAYMLRHIKFKIENSVFELFYLISNAVVLNLYFPKLLESLDLTIIDMVNYEINKTLKGEAFNKMDESKKMEVINTLHSKWTTSRSKTMSKIRLFSKMSPKLLKPILDVR